MWHSVTEIWRISLADFLLLICFFLYWARAVYYSYFDFPVSGPRPLTLFSLDLRKLTVFSQQCRQFSKTKRKPLPACARFGIHQKHKRGSPSSAIQATWYKKDWFIVRKRQTPKSCESSQLALSCNRLLQYYSCVLSTRISTVILVYQGTVIVFPGSTWWPVILDIYLVMIFICFLLCVKGTWE